MSLDISKLPNAQQQLYNAGIGSVKTISRLISDLEGLTQYKVPSWFRITGLDIAMNQPDINGLLTFLKSSSKKEESKPFKATNKSKNKITKESATAGARQVRLMYEENVHIGNKVKTTTAQKQVIEFATTNEFYFDRKGMLDFTETQYAEPGLIGRPRTLIEDATKMYMMKATQAKVAEYIYTSMKKLGY